MKKGLLWSVVALAAIMIIAGFHMQLGDTSAQNLSPEVLDRVLYVCPAKSGTWDRIALAFQPFKVYIIAAFFFGLALLIFGWGWQLYQNLISDKFKRESFKTIWMFTKWGFWAAVITTIILLTPNHFRRVEVIGNGDNWVMCDASTPDAVQVSANEVRAR